MKLDTLLPFFYYELLLEINGNSTAKLTYSTCWPIALTLVYSLKIKKQHTLQHSGAFTLYYEHYLN